MNNQASQQYNRSTAVTIRAATGPMRPVTVRRPQSMIAAAAFVIQYVFLLLDASPSMETEHKNEDAWASLIGLLRELADPATAHAFMCAVIGYHSSAWIIEPLAPVGEVLSRLISTGPPATSYGTNIAASLDMAAGLLGSQLSQVTAIVLGDGMDNCGGDPIRSAGNIKPRALVTTVGFGSDADENVLRRIASGPEYYYKAATGAELKSLFTMVGRALSVSVQSGTNPQAALRSI